MKIPESRLGFLALRAHLERLGLELDKNGNVSEDALRKVTGPIETSPHLRFEDLGLLKKKLWGGREGPGVSVEKTEQAKALAHEARALSLELQGLIRALQHVVIGTQLVSVAGGKIDPHAYDSASSLMARGVNDRLQRLVDKLPESIDFQSLGRTDPVAVRELAEAIGALQGPASEYLGDLSQVRWRLSEAERYYRENPEGAPPARVVMHFEVKGRSYLITLPKEMAEGMVDFERRIIPGMREAEPRIARGPDLEAVYHEVSQTFWSADRAIKALTKLSDSINAPSPLVAAERLLPNAPIATVVMVADRIEAMIEAKKVSTQDVVGRLDQSFATIRDSVPSEADVRARLDQIERDLGAVR